MVLIKMRAVKRINFGHGANVTFVEKGEYFDVEEHQAIKLLKLKAAEVVSEEGIAHGEEYTDIGELIEKLESFKKKEALLEFGLKLGITGISEEMKMAEMKDAIINALEERADTNDL